MRRLPFLLLLAALLGVVAACTDLQSSMPTQPAEPSDSDWTRLYAPLAYRESLQAVWAMDADDAWFGGQRFLLHHDGQHLRRHDLEQLSWVEDIDGCASDEVWAVGNSDVARWDGRRWTETRFSQYSFETVFCEAPDRVWVGGQRNHDHGPWRPVIRRWTGRGWKDWEQPTETRGRVTELWRPHPGGPLVAVVNDTLYHAYQVEEGEWTLLDWPGRPRSVDGDLVLIDGEGWYDPNQLYRVEPDLSLTLLCETFNAPRIFRSWSIMTVFRNEIQYVIDCERRAVLEGTPADIVDVAVPERPGPSSNVIFLVGDHGMALRGTWRPDWTVEWEAVSPLDSYALFRPVLGNETTLFAPASTQDARGILVVDRHGWRHEALGWVPFGLRFLADGDLLVWNGGWDQGTPGDIRWREPGGTWHELPGTGESTTGLWASTPEDMAAMTYDGRFLRLVDGAWILETELGGRCQWFDGVADDRFFAIVDLPQQDARRLLTYDGEAWHDITPEDVLLIDSWYLGPHSGRLWVRARNEDGPERRFVLVEGQWHAFPEGDDAWIYPEYMREASDGSLYYRTGRRLLRWHPGGWKVFYEHEEYLDDFFVDPTGGVHVVWEDHVDHHPYRPR